VTGHRAGARSCSATRLPAWLRHGDCTQGFNISARRFLARAGKRVGSKKLPHGWAVHDDISTLMIYDNFTPTVLFSLEGFGYCGVGESGAFVAEGHLAIGGRYPSNTSGGHLSES
jgi:acetyl-CoA acetyltransferase